MNQPHDSQPPSLADKWEPTRQLFAELGLLQERKAVEVDDAAYRAILKGEAK